MSAPDNSCGGISYLRRKGPNILWERHEKKENTAEREVILHHAI